MVCISSFSYCFEQVFFVRTLSGCRLEPGSVNWVKSRLPKRKQSEELNIGEIETISGLNSCCYKGVRQRSWGRWVSEIREPKKKSRIWLGSFPTPEMAARAYDAAALSIKGEMASLNFPELAASLPRPISTSCKDIQAAAAVAAAALCPPSQLTVADENKRRRNDGKEKTCEVTDKNLLSPTATMDKNFLAEIVGSAEHKEPADLVDEDVIFNLPNLLMHMAEGMLLPPPLPPPSPPCEEDDVGFKGISFLWNF